MNGKLSTDEIAAITERRAEFVREHADAWYHDEAMEMTLQTLPLLLTHIAAQEAEIAELRAQRDAWRRAVDFCKRNDCDECAAVADGTYTHTESGIEFTEQHKRIADRLLAAEATIARVRGANEACVPIDVDNKQRLHWARGWEAHKKNVRAALALSNLGAQPVPVMWGDEPTTIAASEIDLAVSRIARPGDGDKDAPNLGATEDAK